VFPRVGYKHGAWRDAGYWTLHLGDGAPGPRPTRADAAHLPIVVVDAFAERPFEGNPAAVMCLPRWLPDETLARIARENNLSETAFVVTSGGEHHLRWFTPTVEVALCGHATLAAGSVLLADREHAPEEIVFHTRSGPLRVAREGAGFSLDLPSHPAGAPGVPGAVVAALGREPVGGWAVKALHHADYWLVEYPDEATIAALTPDFGALRAQRANVICTAVGRDFDFVSRFFAPGSGVDEDPVTGSAHATLAPFWATRLQTTTLRARQISARGGTVGCVLRGDRVVLTGGCVEVTRGVLTLPPPSEP
jgi:predicted PhzF superfamily epimerase YddE/YHI9